jgi:hypothetical protein
MRIEAVSQTSSRRIACTIVSSACTTATSPVRSRRWIWSDIACSNRSSASLPGEPCDCRVASTEQGLNGGLLIAHAPFLIKSGVGRWNDEEGRTKGDVTHLLMSLAELADRP